MPAKSKSELVAVTEKEFAKLSATLDKVPEELALDCGTDGISIKDIVGHRAHWLALYAGWVADGRAGKEVHTPAPGYVPYVRISRLLVSGVCVRTHGWRFGVKQQPPFALPTTGHVLRNIF